MSFRVRFDFAAGWVSEHGDFTSRKNACVFETSTQSLEFTGEGGQQANTLSIKAHKKELNVTEHSH